MYWYTGMLEMHRWLAVASVLVFALRALELGASGYLGKHRAPAEIAGALLRVLNGGRYIDPETAEALARRGISVKGKIVIARYGAGWRGLKPKLAQEQGAIGCLIYSDPQQDGYGSADAVSCVAFVSGSRAAAVIKFEVHRISP